MLCVLRLALCSTPEIMLDYPVDKLATATAEKCMEYSGVSDRKNGVVSLDQLTRFIETSNASAIFSPPEAAAKVAEEAEWAKTLKN